MHYKYSNHIISIPNFRVYAVTAENEVVSLMSDATSVSSAWDRRRWLVLGVIGIAQLMVVLDGTIVNVALPHIQTALGISDSNLAWVVNVYALALIIALAAIRVTREDLSGVDPLAAPAD